MSSCGPFQLQVVYPGADPEGVAKGRMEAPGAGHRGLESSVVREDRGAKEWGVGFPSPLRGERVSSWVCVPSPQNFSIFELKKASFGAFWD